MVVVKLIVVMLALSQVGCSGADTRVEKSELSAAKLKIVASTQLLQSIVSEIAGDAAEVRAIIPSAADPYSYEPTLQDAREIAQADLAFSNYGLLEDPRVTSALQENLPAGRDHVVLAETALQYAANVKTLISDPSLDALWLGLRADLRQIPAADQVGARVAVRLVGVDGPGDVFTFVTGAFGEPRVFFNSADGLGEDDVQELPFASHTHLSWVFSAPGAYELELQAELTGVPGAQPQLLATGKLRLAVGVDAQEISGRQAQVVDQGHADIAVLGQHNFLQLEYDAEHKHADGNEHQHAHAVRLSEVVVQVPHRTLQDVPKDERFAFLRGEKEQIFMMPQAVLGKSMHGEIDPHLLLHPENVRAYVEAIRDELISVDSKNRELYAQNANRFIAKIAYLEAELEQALAAIPTARRKLVTETSNFNYFADFAELEQLGALYRPGALEASLLERRRVVMALRELGVRAVFAEVGGRGDVIAQLAADAGVELCELYSHALDERVHDYETLMRANVAELIRCL